MNWQRLSLQLNGAACATFVENLLDGGTATQNLVGFALLAASLLAGLLDDRAETAAPADHG